MMMKKSLNEIKRDIALVTLKIQDLDSFSKQAAICYIKESIDLLLIQDTQENRIELGTDQEKDSNDFTDSDTIVSNDEVTLSEVEDHPPVLSIPENSVTMSLYSDLIPTEWFLNPMCDFGETTIATVSDLGAHMNKSTGTVTMEESLNENADYEPESELIIDLSGQPVENSEVCSEDLSIENCHGVSINQKTRENQDNSIEETNLGGYRVAVAECKICKLRFASLKTFRCHKMIHTDKYKCEECQFGFLSILDLKKHRKNPGNCKRIAQLRAAGIRKSHMLFAPVL